MSISKKHIYPIVLISAIVLSLATIMVFHSNTEAQGTPVMSITPDSLVFGDVEINSSKELDFTVTNTGLGVLSGSASASGVFSCVSGCSYNLLASQNQIVTIEFRPTSAGDVNSSVSFSGAGIHQDYKVETSFSFVTISDLQLDATIDYCLPQPQQGIKWTYSGSTNQAAFRVKTEDNNGPDWGIKKVTGLTGSSNTTGIFVSTSPDLNQKKIGYDGSYNVSVQVSDEGDNWSPWSDPLTIETTKHKWPRVDFSLTPPNPVVDQIASTTNASVCFTGNDNHKTPCNSGWKWFVPDGSFAETSTEADFQPLIKFSTAGEGQEVTLRVYDTTLGIDKYCEKTEEFTIRLPLPTWIETRPD